jgi:hypothetical protein
LVVAALALVGCHHPAPTIVGFEADRTLITLGESAVLTWDVKDADRLVLDPGARELHGTSTTVAPVERTTYTLTATSGGGRKQASVTIDVATPVPRFWAVPPHVAPGGSTTLLWDAPSATSVSIDSDSGSLGDHPATGGLVVSPAQGTLYVLQAHDPADPQPAPVTLRVRVSPPPSIQSFGPDQAEVAPGQPVVLRWSADAATYVVDNGPGYVGRATQALVRPLQSTTYTLTAYGATGGSVSATATVAVSGGPPQRALSYADPAVPPDADLALLADPSSTPQRLVLRVIAVQAVAAGGLALDLPLDATRVMLDAQQAGDAAPGFSVTPGALDPGPPPLAASAALGSGPLANVLVLAIAQKATAPGVVPSAQIPPGTELCRIRLVPAAGAQPGTALEAGAAPLQAVLAPLPRAPVAPTAKVAVGALTVL